MEETRSREARSPLAPVRSSARTQDQCGATHRRLLISASRLYILRWLNFLSCSSWGKVSSEICLRYLQGGRQVRWWWLDGHPWVLPPHHIPCVPSTELGPLGSLHVPCSWIPQDFRCQGAAWHPPSPLHGPEEPPGLLVEGHHHAVEPGHLHRDLPGDVGVPQVLGAQAPALGGWGVFEGGGGPRGVSGRGEAPRVRTGMYCSSRPSGNTPKSCGPSARSASTANITLCSTSESRPCTVA